MFNTYLRKNKNNNFILSNGVSYDDIIKMGFKFCSATEGHVEDINGRAAQKSLLLKQEEIKQQEEIKDLNNISNVINNDDNIKKL